ncbi:hypothetical protein PIB30_060536 [Stylosanthes scabra]|uniref:Uncharacterized protein n=1 Tax=Stylosanthes scabra TaxID=79078 RepID=A0ABU6YMG9_9FABA|nr:hypothetical protein [Stylosanthes scabra]
MFLRGRRGDGDDRRCDGDGRGLQARPWSRVVLRKPPPFLAAILPWDRVKAALTGTTAGRRDGDGDTAQRSTVAVMARVGSRMEECVVEKVETTRRLSFQWQNFKAEKVPPPWFALESIAGPVSATVHSAPMAASIGGRFWTEGEHLTTPIHGPKQFSLFVVSEQKFYQ